MSFETHLHGPRFAIEEERREIRFREMACYGLASLSLSTWLLYWVFFAFTKSWEIWLFPLIAMICIAQAQFIACDRRKAEQRLRDWDKTVESAFLDLFPANDENQEKPN
jgi:hypothetical protein